MGRNGRRWLKRHGLKLVLALVLMFSGLSVWQAWDLASHFRSEARESSHRFGQIVAVLNDTTAGADVELLLALAESARQTGIPIVVTDSAGRPTVYANLPARVAVDSSPPALREFINRLDRTNPPIRGAGGATIHYGALPVARRVNWLRGLQLGLLLMALAVGVWAYRASVDRYRDRLWVAMARESAHQLGTPLMSAGAWVERLNAVADDRVQEVGKHLTADLERLERVAQRFERIGRPARRDEVGLGALAERVVAYFAPRLPRRAHAVELTVAAPTAGPMIYADPVLLEWALEALVRNAVDALSGRGGRIGLTVAADGERATITVSDDGPGVDPDVGSRIFDPGFSTKRGGWGIGLALARRIVEEVHEGRLELVPSEQGTVFRAVLPVAATVPSDA